MGLFPVFAAVSSIAGGLAKFFGAKKRTKALNEASRLQRELLGPYSKLGFRAMQDLYNMYSGPIQTSQAFKWRAGEATRLLNQQLAARGLFKSGAAVRSLSDLYSKLTADEEVRRANVLSGLAGYGMSATSPLAANLSRIAIRKGDVKAQLFEDLNTTLVQQPLAMYGARKGYWDLR